MTQSERNMDSIGLTLAGYYSLSDLVLLSGSTELQLRGEAERLSVLIEKRFAHEVVALKDARRLLGQLSRLQPHSVLPGFW